MLTDVAFPAARLRFDFEDRREVDAPVVVLLAASLSGFSAAVIIQCFRSGSFISIRFCFMCLEAHIRHLRRKARTGNGGGGSSRRSSGRWRDQSWHLLAVSIVSAAFLLYRGETLHLLWCC